MLTRRERRARWRWRRDSYWSLFLAALKVYGVNSDLVRALHRNYVEDTLDNPYRED